MLSLVVFGLGTRLTATGVGSWGLFLVVVGCGCGHLIPLVRCAALWGVLGHAFASVSAVGEGHGAVRLGQSLGSIT